eukprot:5337735-Pyramimonas_sp.AAC.1
MVIGESVRFGPVTFPARETVNLPLGPMSLNVPSREDLVAFKATTKLQNASCLVGRTQLGLH